MGNKWYSWSAPSCPIRRLSRRKYIRWPPGSNRHPGLEFRYPGLPSGLSNLIRGPADPLSGSVRFMTNCIRSRVSSGLVGKMIPVFSGLHGSLGDPPFLGALRSTVWDRRWSLPSLWLGFSSGLVVARPFAPSRWPLGAIPTVCMARVWHGDLSLWSDQAAPVVQPVAS